MEMQHKDPRWTMKRLVEASGLNRQTIHFYLREGLLPGAAQAGGTRNATYSSGHVELLDLIRELRDERGMSLEAIRRLFEQAQFRPQSVRRVIEVGPPGALDVDAERMSEAELLSRSGADEAQLELAILAGVIDRDTEEREAPFEREALSILSAFKRLEHAGLARRSLERLLEHVRALTSLEVAALVGDVSGKSDGSEPVARLAERRYADLSELISAARRSALRKTVRRLSVVGPRARRFAEDSIYVPSELFIKRHNLETIRDEAEAQALKNPRDAELSRRLGRLLLGLGRYDEAEGWFVRSVSIDSTVAARAETFAYLGMARATSGRVAEGVQAARRAVELAPESPRAHAFLGAVLAVRAALSEVGDQAEMLREALQAASHSRALEPADPRERLEVLLARGRLFTVLPGEATAHVEGVGDLRAVLAATAPSALSNEEFEFPATSTLYRIHALYYLGMSAFQEGRHDEASALLLECITLDPSSRFAHYAYELHASIAPK